MGQKIVCLLIASCFWSLQTYGQDKAALDTLFDSLAGNGWKSRLNWKTTARLDLWYGIETTASKDRVRIIDLDGTLGPGPSPYSASTNGNMLKGRIPALSLPMLEKISLSNNDSIIGPVPDFKGMPELAELFLQNCNLSGRLQNQFDENHKLEQLNLQSNNLQGSIPGSLFLNENLELLYLHVNNFSEQIPNIPIRANIKTLNIRFNQFTFEDILPFYLTNIGILSSVGVEFYYSDQAPIPTPPQVTPPLGFPFSIDLGIDSEVAENVYYWYKDGKPYDTIDRSPILKFDSISTLEEGIYSCKIRNTILKDLELTTRNITLKTCAPDLTIISEKQLCPTESRTIQGKTYDVVQPNDTIYLRGQASNGCDAITVVQLEFQNVTRSEISICAGSSYRGTIVNTSGLYKFTTPRTNAAECESMDLVKINVIDEAQKYGEAKTGIDRTLCTANYTLSGNPAPANVVGKWQERGGNGLMGVAGENTINLDLKPGLNTFEWTFSTPMCPNFSKDEINLFLESAPILVNDTVEVTIGEPKDSIMPLQNDTINFIRDKKVSWPNPPGPAEGIFTLEQEGERFTFFTDIPMPRELKISYTVQSDSCSALKGTATVLLKIVPKRNPEVDPPNVITPNGDGYNDTFFIPQLVDSFEENRNNRFIVYNKWMQRVYEEPDYRNKWGGWDQNLQALPAGWYKFYFQAGKNGPIRGEILILR